MLAVFLGIKLWKGCLGEETLQTVFVVVSAQSLVLLNRLHLELLDFVPLNFVLALAQVFTRTSQYAFSWTLPSRLK